MTEPGEIVSLGVPIWDSHIRDASELFEIACLLQMSRYATLVFRPLDRDTDSWAALYAFKNMDPGFIYMIEGVVGRMDIYSVYAVSLATDSRLMIVDAEYAKNRSGGGKTKVPSGKITCVDSSGFKETLKKAWNSPLAFKTTFDEFQAMHVDRVTYQLRKLNACSDTLARLASFTPMLGRATFYHNDNNAFVTPVTLNRRRGMIYLAGRMLTAQPMEDVDMTTSMEEEYFEVSASGFTSVTNRVSPPVSFVIVTILSTRNRNRARLVYWIPMFEFYDRHMMRSSGFCGRGLVVSSRCPPEERLWTSKYALDLTDPERAWNRIQEITQMIVDRDEEQIKDQAVSRFNTLAIA